MGSWPATIARVLVRVRGSSLDTLPAIVRSIADAAGRPVAPSTASRIVRGHSLPCPVLWQALVDAAGLYGEWRALKGELDAERAARRGRKAGKGMRRPRRRA